MYKLTVGLNVHFTKLNRSPQAPVYFLALLEDLGQKGQHASRAGSGGMAQVWRNEICEWYVDAVVHWPGILIKTEILISPVPQRVNCLQFTPESFSWNCLQCGELLCPDYTAFQGSSLPDWDDFKGPPQPPRKSCWLSGGSQLQPYYSLAFPSAQFWFLQFLRALLIQPPVHTCPSHSLFLGELCQENGYGSHSAL